LSIYFCAKDMAAHAKHAKDIAVHAKEGMTGRILFI
jgi:hypothetical protein